MSIFQTTRRRWGDNDRYFGPFTYARDGKGYRPLAVVLKSAGDGYDDGPGSSLRVSGFGHTFIIALPALIKPWRQWVDTSKYQWSDNPAGGYWDIHAREYGFSVSEGFLQVFLGQQTHDSQTTKSWSKFLPWTQWRHVRHSVYGLAGDHLWTEPKGAPFSVYYEIKQTCPSATFAFADFDGEELTARTHIEEREWLFGEGWFKWLSLFRKPKVHRSLDIGLRPDGFNDTRESMAATKAHLEDMREIAFHKIGAEKPT